MKISNKTMRESTEEWVASQGDWVCDPLHAPAITQMLVLADGIDQDPTKSSLHAQFGLIYRALLSERPKDTLEFDALDAILGVPNASV